MYKDLEDNELLLGIAENNEEAFQELIERYTPKINAIVSKYKLKGIQVGLDALDLYQEGLIGLVESVKTFKEEKEASFKTYTTIIIERQLLDLIKNHSRIKYKSLNNAVSLDNFSTEENTSYYNIVEVDNLTPEVKLIDKEDTEEIKNFLTEFELKVYELKLEGKTNREISIILEKNLIYPLSFPVFVLFWWKIILSFLLVISYICNLHLQLA